MRFLSSDSSTASRGTFTSSPGRSVEQPGGSSRRSAKRVAALVTTAALAFGGLFFAQPASAAELAGVFTDIHIVETEQFDRGAVQVAYTMEVPDEATEGDTTILGFPELLDYPSGQTVEVRDPDGLLVATGVATGEKEITFTFTDYVDNNLDVVVTGHYGLLVDDPAANNTEKEFVFTNSGEPFTDRMITKPAVLPPLTSVYIKGYWTDEDDRGKENPEDAVIWRGSLNEGPWDEQTVTMRPVDNTTLFNCDSVEFWEGYAPNGAIYHGGVHESTWQSHGDGAEIGASVVSCTPTELVTHFSQATVDSQVYQVRVLADVVDTDSTAYFEGTIANGETSWLNFVARDLGLGEGNGIIRVPAVELTKYSLEEGIEEGDFDEAPGKTLTREVDETIVFRITNTGNDTLSGITLTDKTVSGDEVTLSCDLDGVVILPGEYFECQGLLEAPSTDGSHQDEATVVATGMRSGDRVQATDSWFGFLEAEPVPSPTPTKPVDNSDEPGDDLAVTGADLDYSLFWLAGIAIGGGLIVTTIAYSRSRARVRQTENL
ncbi:hypothetical protein CLV49_0575 [Labedella gwakjiensis]|uniref:SDR-like Ig domain-containing protein n=1 Tax=Labedella gwakjiensis TaxID=390269 RepID=A0A2P8GSP2_9MICO|nr:hypothetical protein CLV49_0575 [Labedella gwakjiensis]